MENKEETYQKALARLKDYLQDHKMRKTPERYEVLRAVCLMNDIFTIDQIAEEMEQKASFCVSRSTLFNTLEILVEAKIVLKHNLMRAGHYECNVDPKPRACLVCECCGSVKRLDKNNIVQFLGGIKARLFTIQQPILYLHGTCRKCTMAMKRTKSSKRERKN